MREEFLPEETATDCPLPIPSPTFLDIPNEICILIAKGASDPIKTMGKLACVNRRFHSLFKELLDKELEPKIEQLVRYVLTGNTDKAKRIYQNPEFIFYKVNKVNVGQRTFLNISPLQAAFEVRNSSIYLDMAKYFDNYIDSDGKNGRELALAQLNEQFHEEDFIYYYLDIRLVLSTLTHKVHCQPLDKTFTKVKKRLFDAAIPGHSAVNLDSVIYAYDVLQYWEREVCWGHSRLFERNIVAYLAKTLLPPETNGLNIKTDADDDTLCTEMRSLYRNGKLRECSRKKRSDLVNFHKMLNRVPSRPNAPRAATAASPAPPPPRPSGAPSTATPTPLPPVGSVARATISPASASSSLVSSTIEMVQAHPYLTAVAVAGVGVALFLALSPSAPPPGNGGNSPK